MKSFFLMVVFATLGLLCFPQTENDTSVARDPLHARTDAIITKRLGALAKESASISDQIVKKTTKGLRRLAREEERIAKYITTADSNTKNVFANVQDKYAQLIALIESSAPNATPSLPNYYIPRLDTLLNALKLLAAEGNADHDIKSELGISIEALVQLDNKLERAYELMNFMKLRRQVIKETLSKYRHLPSNITKSFKKINKEVYYYREQVLYFKDILNEPNKLDELLVGMAKRIPAFTWFLAKNSRLAGVFLPGGSGRVFLAASEHIPVVSGLQQRYSVEQVMQSVSASSANAQQLMHRQVRQGMRDALQVKQKFTNRRKVDEGELGGFTVNSQRKKSFWQRLEYSTDLQFGRSIRYLPAIADISLQASYRLNDQGSLGIGTVYKVGLGEGWSRIRFTHQGIGFRSTLNWKLKGSFYVQGNAEMNYMSAFNSYDQLKAFNKWQQAGLLGVAKRYTLSKKIKGTFQVLYDFLHKAHIPHTQGIIIRKAYNF
jgi:hypothetical protein